MRAAVHLEYGEPDLIRIVDLPQPECPDDGYLVRVKACSANPADWKYIKGNWSWVTRGRFPRQIGADFSGVVAASGARARMFKAGDEVIGSVNPFKTGTAAEYVAVGEGQLCLKPSSTDFTEAAGIPIAAGTAYIGLAQSQLDIAGRSVLITGAGGGVGHLAVQLARYLGARVTGVCSAAKASFVSGLGAETVVNYAVTDIRNTGDSFDLIMDCAASLDFSQARGLLNFGGEYILLELNGKLLLFVSAALSRVFLKKHMRTYLASPSRERCEKLVELFDSGALEITVGGRYPLEKAGEALSELKAGHAKGKIVINIE